MTDSPFDGENASKYTTTLKGGTGYDRPWIVVRSNSVAELKSDVGALDDEAFGLVQSAGNRFAGSVPANHGAPAPQGASQGFGQAAQQFANAGMTSQQNVTDAYTADANAGGPGAFAVAAQDQPPWQVSGGNQPAAQPAAKVCKHGEMVKRNRKKDGAPFWACPQPFGAPDQCKPQAWK